MISGQPIPFLSFAAARKEPSWCSSPGGFRRGDLKDHQSLICGPKNVALFTAAAWFPLPIFMSFTGKRSPKSKWRFTKAGEEWFCIAGLWRPVEDSSGAFTMLTCEPGPDVMPIHNRQVVVLERWQWLSWLDPEHSGADLLRPSPAGTLEVEQVR